MDGAIRWRPTLQTRTEYGHSADWEVMIDHM
jgi:hypothetical protein